VGKTEFDDYSSDYESLLRDPLRDRFTSGAGSQFFHIRKRDLILDFWRQRAVDTRRLSYLDLGCGKGELLSLLKPSFGSAAGCDPSTGMMQAVAGVEVRVQNDPCAIPFDNGQFDFVTAVCVYHHVPVPDRARLTAEAKRVLKPGGIFCIVEHNPYNPATRIIVSRTPVDASAILLPPSETRSLLTCAGLSIAEQKFFLYLPAPLYNRAGRVLERALAHVPLGGQYAIFGEAESR
jgi:SAM-dependent methyltransferase